MIRREGQQRRAGHRLQLIDPKQAGVVLCGIVGRHSAWRGPDLRGETLSCDFDGRRSLAAGKPSVTWLFREARDRALSLRCSHPTVREIRLAAGSSPARHTQRTVVVAESQLSFIDSPRVVTQYYPSRQPPDATGPFEWGSFRAELVGSPALAGWGRTEHLAVTALAARLRERVADGVLAPGLSAVQQAFAAAQRMSADDLVGWLIGRAAPAVLYEAVPDQSCWTGPVVGAAADCDTSG